LSKTKSQTCLRTAGYHQESRHRRSRRRAATRDLATEFDRYPDPAFRAGFFFFERASKTPGHEAAPDLMPRIVGSKVMMPADLKRLHKCMREVGHISIVSDECRPSALVGRNELIAGYDEPAILSRHRSRKVTARWRYASV